MKNTEAMNYVSQAVQEYLAVMGNHSPASQHAMTEMLIPALKTLYLDILRLNELNHAIESGGDVNKVANYAIKYKEQT